MEPHEISDRLEIADVLTRYTRAIDAGEWDRLDTVFTPDADIDYTFAQVQVKEAKVDYSANCGNMSSAMGPFAVDEGIIKVSGKEALVRVHNTNTKKIINARFAIDETETMAAQLLKAGIAFGRVNDVSGLSRHADLRRIEVATPTGPVVMPAPPARVANEEATFGPVPSVGEHSDKVRAEFS